MVDKWYEIRFQVHLCYWYLIPHKDKYASTTDNGYRWLCLSIWIPKKKKKSGIGFNQ